MIQILLYTACFGGCNRSKGNLGNEGTSPLGITESVTTREVMDSLLSSAHSLSLMAANEELLSLCSKDGI